MRAAPAIRRAESSHRFLGFAQGREPLGPFVLQPPPIVRDPHFEQFEPPLQIVDVPMERPRAPCVAPDPRPNPSRAERAPHVKVVAPLDTHRSQPPDADALWMPRFEEQRIRAGPGLQNRVGFHLLGVIHMGEAQASRSSCCSART